MKIHTNAHIFNSNLPNPGRGSDVDLYTALWVQAIQLTAKDYQDIETGLARLSREQLVSS